jgi:hypothetical protein
MLYQLFDVIQQIYKLFNLKNCKIQYVTHLKYIHRVSPTEHIDDEEQERTFCVTRWTKYY